MSCVHPACQSAVLRGKNFNVECYTQTFQPILFIPTILICTIDLYHLIPLPLTLTLLGDHNISAWLHFLAHFATDQDEMFFFVEEIQVEGSDISF